MTTVGKIPMKSLSCQIISRLNTHLQLRSEESKLVLVWSQLKCLSANIVWFDHNCHQIKPKWKMPT